MRFDYSVIDFFMDTISVADPFLWRSPLLTFSHKQTTLKDNTALPPSRYTTVCMLHFIVCVCMCAKIKGLSPELIGAPSALSAVFQFNQIDFINEDSRL